MTGHAKETTMLWDSCEMTLPTTDNRGEPTEQYVSDPYKLSDICPFCDDGFIGPDGCANGCND